MKACISNKIVNSIKPQKKRYEIRDTKLIGFVIRVFPTGKASYQVCYKRGKAITIGDVNVLTPAQARERAKEILGDAAKGIDPIEQKHKIEKENLTFGKYIEEYGLWVVMNRKAGKDTLARIKRNFLSGNENKKLTEITPRIIDKWCSMMLAKGREKSSLNREIAAIKSALSKAVEWKMIEHNPVSQTKFYKIDSNPKTRYLDEDEEPMLMNALDRREENIRTKRDNHNEWRRKQRYSLLPNLRNVEYVDHLKPLVILSLKTGARRGELFNLVWDDIDFKKKIMTIQAQGTKSGKTLQVPLTPEALYVLQAWKEQTSRKGKELVFPGKGGKRMNNCDSAFEKVLEDASIKDFDWHDLRHSFASKLRDKGVPLETISELMGHSDIRMTQRYAHIGDETKYKFISLLDARPC